MLVFDLLTHRPRVSSGASRFRQAQAGGRDALNALMAEYEGLVHYVLRQQSSGCLSYAEVLQAGRTGLWQAILGFDPQRGTAFYAYARTAIQRQIWREVKKANRSHARPLIEAVCLPEGEPDPAELWEAATVHAALYDLVGRLPSRLWTIIVHHYGLAENLPTSYRQLGRVLHLSHERVHQLHTQALVWLRHPAHSQRLRTLLNRHTQADYEMADAEAQRWLQQRGGRHGR
jgi:RNA polymerase sigma factor (sigma-70 family)